MVRALIIALLLIFAVVIGWHLFFPMLGGIIALTAAAWAAIIGFIVLLTVGTLLLFALPIIGIFVLGGFMVAAVFVGIILFPILSPIILPLLIVFLFVMYLRRRKIKGTKNQTLPGSGGR